MNAFNTIGPVRHSRNMKWISEHCESWFLTAVKSLEAVRLVQLALTTDAALAAAGSWSFGKQGVRGRSREEERPGGRPALLPVLPSPLWNSALCCDLSQLFVSPEWTTGGKTTCGTIRTNCDVLLSTFTSSPQHSPLLLFCCLSSFYVLLSQFEFSWLQLVDVHEEDRLKLILNMIQLKYFQSKSMKIFQRFLHK